MKNQPFAARVRFALTGLVHAWRHERSVRAQVLALAVVAVALGAIRPRPLWWALAALVSGGVLAFELLNTAIERLADHLHPERHPEIRIVKDCAAAAVLVMAVTAVAIAIAFVVDAVS